MADTPEANEHDGQVVPGPPRGGFDLTQAVNGMLANVASAQGGEMVQHEPQAVAVDVAGGDEGSLMDQAIALVGEQRACVGDIGTVVGAIGQTVQMIGATEALKAAAAGVPQEQIDRILAQVQGAEQGQQGG